MKPLCLVVPVYGQHELTRALLEDVRREEAVCDVVIVDNRGDFQTDEAILMKPGRNLGWLGGTNYGLKFADQRKYPYLVCCNNDVRLSRGFCAALLEVAQRSGCGVFGPTYRGDHPHQWPSTGYQGEAAAFQPTGIVRKTGFLDGTCFGFSRTLYREIGGLDPLFEPLGWGADQDFCIRVRDRGLDVVITEDAYLYHLAGATAKTAVGDFYWKHAGADLTANMRTKYGPDFAQRVWGRWRPGPYVRA